MLTSNHPNAVWLAALYRGKSAIESDPTLDDVQRDRRKNAHFAECSKRMSPDLIIHTGGVRLATTGDLTFMRAYGRRRAALTDGDHAPLELDQIIADDYYGIVHGTFRTARGNDVWERVGMGAWRFEGGMAVEHWELPNGPRWDAFFLAGDPDFDPPSAMAFWTRS